MATKNNLHIYRLILGGLCIAFFALVGNIPLFSAVYLIPGVPITLQNFIIAMMGLTLGLRGGMVSYISLLLLTLCGLPMMSGGKGGPAALFGPTGGYIFGWVFIVLLLGIYSSYFINKLINKKILGISIHIPVSFCIGMLGILLGYLSGTLGLIIFYTDKSMADFFVTYTMNFAFLPGDIIKIALASVFSLILFVRPELKRMFNQK
ncbi:MAG: biotin transporter BioY [Oscillospiraceae bacterium]|nr:biotin transporter BioY [Oscillospiraceae bacterium]MDD4414078.1 biotin transporter BioY [Oscillospiraceae bacterium]